MLLERVLQGFDPLSVKKGDIFPSREGMCLGMAAARRWHEAAVVDELPVKIVLNK